MEKNRSRNAVLFKTVSAKGFPNNLSLMFSTSTVSEESQSRDNKLTHVLGERSLVLGFFMIDL